MIKKNAVDFKDQGNTYFKEGDYENALQYFGKAVEIDPEYRDAWNNIYLTLLKLDRTDDAKRCKEILDRLEYQPDTPLKGIQDRQFSRIKKLLSVIIVILLALAVIMAALSILGWVSYREVIPVAPEHYVDQMINNTMAGFLNLVSPASDVSNPGYSSKTINVTVVKTGNTIVIRNNGGTDIGRVSVFNIWIDDMIQNQRLGKEQGSSLAIRTNGSSHNHIVVTGRLTDSSEQVILDTFV
jgi:hypothetical protein